MLYREIIAVCSEIHTKHTHTKKKLCGQNVEFFNFKLLVHEVTSGLRRGSCILFLYDCDERL